MRSKETLKDIPGKTSEGQQAHNFMSFALALLPVQNTDEISRGGTVVMCPQVNICMLGMAE